jgi:hypothetical protein
MPTMPPDDLQAHPPAACRTSLHASPFKRSVAEQFPTWTEEKAKPSSFHGAPGRAHLLGGESPLLTRQGEELAEGKGVSGDWASEGSRKQNAGLMNKKRIRGDVLG